MTEENNNCILIVDIETTGFLNQGGSIVEIGIVSLDLRTGDIELVFDSLLKEAFLSARHHHEPYGWIFKNSTLTIEEVRNARPGSIVLAEVQEVLNKHPLGATAYNKKFDFDFLRNRGLKIKDLPCPMHLSTNILKIPGRYTGYKWPSAQEAYDYFFPDNDYTELHRGADDAYHEAKIVWELYKMGVFKVK